MVFIGASSAVGVAGGCAPGGLAPGRPGVRNSMVFIGASSAGGVAGGWAPGGLAPGRPGVRNSMVFIGASAGGVAPVLPAAGGAPGSPICPGRPMIVCSAASGGVGVDEASSGLPTDSRTKTVLPMKIRAPGGSVVFSPDLMTLSSTRVGLVAPSPSSTTNPDVTLIRNCLRLISWSSTVKSTL